MQYLGVRCTNKDCCYVVLTGDYENPVLLKRNEIRFPKDFSRPKTLQWFYREIEGLIQTEEIDLIVMKGMEPMADKNSTTAQHRTENEAIVLLCAENAGIFVDRVVDASISAKLGGERKYKRKQNYAACVEKFGDADDKTKEAILAAWVKMN
ncbi:MAG TPA: hypothetical protein VK612_06230 [Pyrinomonadaceae bacterium]|nr:hypothetical protein [Pyrinomonadaceae bacterium]